MQKQQKIRIKLKSYNQSLMVSSCDQIVDTLSQINAQIVGPICLPTKRKIYCVLRSPHVDKDSREHFELRIHNRMIDIYTITYQTIDSLMKINLPAGVDIEVKL